MTNLFKFPGAAIATAVLLAMGSTAALAQTAGEMPASRANVKAEARAANKANAIPAGEQDPLQNQSPSATTGANARGDVKSQARAANRANAIPAGEQNPLQTKSPSASTGAVPRSEVKAQAANKGPRPFGATGERPDVVTNPPVGGTPK